MSYVDLEPSLVSHGTYASRSRVGAIDTAAVLSLMVILLLLLPARMIVPDLTDFGRPATIVGLGLTFWWFVARFSPQLTMTGPQPIRWAALAYLGAMLTSHVAGYMRGLPTLEANGADRSLIMSISFLGIIVMTADGIANRNRMDLVLRTLVWSAGLMAILGIAQWAFQDNLIQNITIPGLKLKAEMIGLESRGDNGMVRVPSTATHYIEFSAVMALALPFAIHFSRFGATKFKRQLFALTALVIAAAIPLTLSRTGILAAIVVIAVMLSTWPTRFRFNVLFLGAAMTAAFAVVSPGLIGTIRSLFFNIFTGNDLSVQGRTDDYVYVGNYFSQRPFFGRGAGTFIPNEYRFIDNQWFGTLIESGLVGVAALAALHITAISLTIIARRRSVDEVDRHLCTCLLAVQIGAVVCAFTFDSLGFGTFATTLMMLTGLAGVMWRLTHPARTVRTAVARQR